MYEQPIHPKNLWLEQDPLTHEPVDEIYRANIGRLLKRDARHRGGRASWGPVPGLATTGEQWQEIKHFWEGWGAESPAPGRCTPQPRDNDVHTPIHTQLVARSKRGDARGDRGRLG